MKRSAFVLSLALVLALSGLAMANDPLGGVEPLGFGGGINWCKWFPSWCHGGGGGGTGGDPGPGSDDPSLSDIAKADGSSWADTDTARAFTGDATNGSCNRKCHDNEITIGVSVAQWIEYSLSATRIDFQVLKSGEYSAPFMDINVASNSDVELKVWAADPTYQADASASPEIATALALVEDGGSRPAPDDAAWFEAKTANDAAVFTLQIGRAHV